MKRGGKAAAVAGLLGLGAVVVAGTVFRDTLLEEWKLRLLRSGDEEAKAAALVWLEAHSSIRAVPVLIEFLASPPEGPSVLELQEALRRIIESRRAEAVPVVARRLYDPDLEVRRVAARTMVDLWPESVAAVDSLLHACSDTDDIVRYRASAALQSIGKPAVSPLLAALSGPDPELRAHAAWLLGAIGPAAREAVPLLREAARDPDPAVRAEAEAALRRIGEEP